MEFGNVRRGILGVEGGRINAIASKELGIAKRKDFLVSIK
jgi:hypothetical protein